MQFPEHIRAHVAKKMAHYEQLCEESNKLTTQRVNLALQYTSAVKNLNKCQQAFGGHFMASQMSVTVGGLKHSIQVIDEQLEEKIARMDGIDLGVESLLLGYLYDSSVVFRERVADAQEVKRNIDYANMMCDDFLGSVSVGLRKVTNAQISAPGVGHVYIPSVDGKKISAGIHTINASIKLFDEQFEYGLLDGFEEKDRVQKIMKHHRLTPVDNVHAVQEETFVILEKVRGFQEQLRRVAVDMHRHRYDIVHDARRACTQGIPYR